MKNIYIFFIYMNIVVYWNVSKILKVQSDFFQKKFLKISVTKMFYNFKHKNLRKGKQYMEMKRNLE